MLVGAQGREQVHSGTRTAQRFFIFITTAS